MTKTLPKGHVSCLSKSFRYTPALNTNVAATFARITRELKLRAAVGVSNTTERALRLASHLVHSS